jgi:hypothetical protein
MIYSVFPLYYTHVYHFKSDEWPFFNRVIEYYLMGRLEHDFRGAFRRIFAGLSDQDRANLALMEYSLDEILKNPFLVDNPDAIIEVKSEYLYNLFQTVVEEDDFLNYMNDFLASMRFESRQVSGFISAFKTNFGEDLKQYFDTWMSATNLPAFIISDVQCYEILEENQVRYQVRFRVENLASVDGLIHTEFRTRGGGPGGPMGGPGRIFDQPEGVRTIRVAGNQAIEAGIILDSQPFLLTVNTLTSQNIPSIITRNFQDIETREDAIPFDGIRLIESKSESAVSGTFIVDNEDPGFRIHQSRESRRAFLGFLGSASSREVEYIDLRLRNQPQDWQPTVGDSY